MKLSIIILSWNTKKLLSQCLESITQNLKLNAQAEVIVVDNNSNDGSKEVVKKEFPEVKLIENKENFGYSKGNNIGIKKAEGDYVMILNSDTLIKPEAINNLVDFLDGHKEIDIIGPRLLNVDGTPQANCGYFPGLKVAAVMLFGEHFGGSNLVRYSPEKSRFVDWLMGAAFITRKEVFNKVGGFDEKLFLYMEEVEWFYRTRKAGFKAYFLKEAEIIHLGMGSSKSGRKEPILNIYKGLIYFYRKHKSSRDLIFLKLLLKFKALTAYFIGIFKNNLYLKETYGEALKIN